MAGGKYAGPGRAGFTLLELLVVMMIVTVAVALLYPVFAQVRERGRQAVCLSHVAQHARAVLLYAEDYDERLPVAWNWVGANTADNDTIYPHWWNALRPYLRSSDVFNCPSDAGYLGMRPGDPFNNQPFYSTFGSSYASTVGWTPSHAGAYPLPPQFQQPGGLGGMPLAAILDPSRTPFSFDSWPFWHSGVRELLAALENDELTLNASYFDGSARRTSYRAVTTYVVMGPAGPPKTPQVALGDPAPVYPAPTGSVTTSAPSGSGSPATANSPKPAVSVAGGPGNVKPPKPAGPGSGSPTTGDAPEPGTPSADSDSPTDEPEPPVSGEESDEVGAPTDASD